MSKATIEISDEDGQVSVVTTVTGFADDSKACQITERVLMYIDRIAERQGKPELVPQIVRTAGEYDAARLKATAPAPEPTIILAH